jgi:hypothetical protein
MIFVRHRLERPSMVYQEGTPWVLPVEAAPPGDADSSGSEQA